MIRDAEKLILSNLKDISEKKRNYKQLSRQRVELGIKEIKEDKERKKLV